MTTVGLLGEGPAIEAVRAAVGDLDASTVAVESADAAACDLVVTAGPAEDGFGDAVADARAASRPLVVVELGGVGGVPVAGVDVAVSGSTPETACHDCLRGRVTAADPETDDGTYDAATERFAGSLAGYHLEAILDGRPSTVLGGVVEVPHAERRVLPLPYCDCAPPEDRTLRRTPEDRTLDESLSRAEGAFDARVGPVTSVGEVDSFPAPYYLATLAGTPFSDADAPDHAAGVATDWDPAFMKALGESLERYSAAVYRRSAFDEDPADPVDPEAFVQPGDPPASVEHWHEATHLRTGRTVQLPAETVVFPPPERAIRPAITTGLGFGNGGVEALLSGLYEVVERDAAMLAWYSTFEPLALGVDDEGYRALSARVRSEDLETVALLLTQDVDVPVVAACVYRDGEWPRFAAGMAADLDPDAAARGALEEAVQNWLELRRMGPDRAGDASGAIGRYAEFPPAAREFVSPETTVPASSLAAEPLPSGPDELDALVDRVGEVGLDAYGARLTPRDVESLGFEAVRVVVPRAQPLFTGDPFFGDRARAVPEELGFAARPEREHHPFP